MIFLAGNSGCIKSSIIGNDILKDDEIFVDFSDIVNITATSLKNDSFEVFPNSRNSYILGKFENSTIGSVMASLAMDFDIRSDIPDTVDLQNLIIDSLVLSLNIDSTFHYGDSLASHTIQVFELDENVRINSSDTSIRFYSNHPFIYNQNIVGQINVIPDQIDTITVIEPKNDTVRYSQMIRIKLDNSLAARIMEDTSILGNTEKFKNVFKGLFIKSDPGISSMLGVAKYNSSGTIASKLEIYYSILDTPSKLSFSISNVVPVFNHNYSGSEMENFFGSSALADSLIFIQGLTGSKLRIQITGLDTLANKNINKAELVLYTADYDIKNEIPFRLIAFIEDESGTLTQLEDYVYSESLGVPYYYNGYAYDFEENGLTGKKYRIGLTTHIKKLMKNGNYSTRLIILPTDRIGNPGFSKFYGPRNSKLRTKLNIVFSDKN